MKRLTVLMLIPCAWIALRGAPAPAAALNGSWEGAISIMGQELKFAVHFSESEGTLKAAMDIPQQGAMGLPLTQVRRDGDRVHFELVAGPGVAVFDGVMAAGAIAGDFLQAGIKGTFRLAPRGENAAAPAPAPAAPLPYREEEVAVAHGEVKLSGTLTIPEGPGPFPAVILITGSGTQNRDEEIFGFKLFRVIADHLTRQGIAVLRCDDRAFGASGPAGDATSADFAADVNAQARYLRERPEIDPQRVGLLGHSEGGLIAPLAQREGHFAFMVLMAGTSVKGEDVILEQMARIARADGAAEKEIRRDVALQKRIFSLLGDPRGERELGEIILAQARLGLEQLSPEQRRAITDAESYVQTMAKAQLLSLRSPWYRYFLAYDPVPALEALACPVLALFGEKDIQVIPAQNRPPMEKALRKGGNRDVTFRVFPGANHLFQKAGTGSPSEYAALEKAFVPGFLETISSWISEKTKHK
ncbi:MAG TPA: alpha/beta fold hydrolase [Candidatus Aminicenantes bacterium]|nr:alpha/beta fold hydrolase [Candidatus Aminicenantes bacterium]